MTDLFEDLFADFAVPEENTLLKNTRTPNKKKKKTITKVSVTEEDKLHFAKKIEKTDYRIPQITEEVREVIYRYYRNKDNIIYEQKHKESVEIAETLIEENISKLQYHLDNCIKIKPTCTQKGWNINLSTKDKAYSLIITCMFLPNYIRRYLITKITGSEYEVIKDISIPCEKTVV